MPSEIIIDNQVYTMKKSKMQEIACEGNFWKKTVPMFEKLNKAPKKLMKGKGKTLKSKAWGG